MQRNSVTADWGDGTQYDTFTPDFNAAGGRYIKYMIRAHGHPNFAVDYSRTSWVTDDRLSDQRTD